MAVRFDEVPQALNDDLARGASVLEKYGRLNDEGRAKVDDYIEILIKTGSYQKPLPGPGWNKSVK
jgi:hypothetical protein